MISFDTTWRTHRGLTTKVCFSHSVPVPLIVCLTCLIDIPLKFLPFINLGYTAVVLYLANQHRLKQLLLSLKDLKTNVNMYPWPILLFYTDDLKDEALRNEFIIRLYDFVGGDDPARWFVSRIEWIELEWGLPDTISHDKPVVDPVFEYVWPGTLLRSSS